jgi:hypothetical protein
VTRTLAVVAAPAADPDLAGLRRRLSGATIRETVALDFLEDDLREAERALGEVTGWLDAVKEALLDARGGCERLAAAARQDPGPRVDELEGALASVRRRVVQVAAGLAAGRPAIDRRG